MTAEQTFTHEPRRDDPDAVPVPLGALPVSQAEDDRPLPRAQRVAPSAADMTSERMLRAQSEPPPSGWRRLLFRLSGGMLNAGPSAADRERRELVGRVKSPVVGCRRIAVVSRKGGVGKTTTTLMLGHTFASLRGDRVIALDGNPDAGSLAYRVRRETSNTITGLLAHRDQINRYADIRAYTSQAPTRLEVVAADDDPRITDALVEQDFHTAVELLEVHYNLVCLDTGTGVLESAAKGILQLADQIVVVTAPSLDSARTASSTLDWLDRNGHADLVEGAVAVVNGVRPRSQLELDRVVEHFSQRCREVVRVPWDPHLEAGAESTLDQLHEPTRNAYLRLAAAVAAGFALDPLPVSERSR
ncbi:MAG: AAA family ATPase [Solirubrobacterales bacterium]